MTMEYRNIATRQVSAIGFGGGAISGEGGGYGLGSISETDALSLLHYVYEKGINLFDAAPIYGFGTCERRLGLAFKGERRNKVFLVTKGGITWDHSKRVNLSNRPEIIEKMLHQSLKDLQSDYIDLYMIHWPDPKVDIRFSMEVLAKAQQSGKIHFIGLGNTTIQEIQKAQEVVSISAIQNQLNLFYPEISTELFPFLKEQKISCLAWGTLDKGILTGRVNADRQFDPVDARSWAPWWKKERLLREKKYYAVEQLKKIVKRNQGLSLLSLILGHNLQFSEVTSTLCGGRTKEQWDELLGVLEALPSAQQLKESEESLQSWSTNLL